MDPVSRLHRRLRAGEVAILDCAPIIDRARVWGIGLIPAAWFLATTAWANRKHPASSPNWNHTRHCNAPLQPGLWAVEPHVARDGIDDDLAHTRRWQRASAA